MGAQLAGKSEGIAIGGGPRQPGGGPGGAGRGGRGFGIGGFLAPVWSNAADGDANGQITSTEFQALSSRWAGEWDSDRDASLNETELLDGLGKAFPAPTPNGQATTPRAHDPDQLKLRLHNELSILDLYYGTGPLCAGCVFSNRF